MGDIAALNRDGLIVSEINSFTEVNFEVDRIMKLLRNDFNQLEEEASMLPPVDYEVSRDSHMSYLITDPTDLIVKAACAGGYVYIHKEQDEETTTLFGYRHLLKTINDENASLRAENNELRHAYDILLEQKRNYRKNALLTIAVVIGSILLILLGYYLLTTQSELDDAMGIIERTGRNIHQKDDVISELEAEKDELKLQLTDTRQKLGRLNTRLTQFTQHYPVIINNIELANFDAEGNMETTFGGTLYAKTMKYIQPRISYSTLDSVRLTLDIKIIKMADPSSGFDYAYSMTDVHFDQGLDLSMELDRWGGKKRKWEAGRYRIEIWSDHLMLHAHDFIITSYRAS